MFDSFGRPYHRQVFLSGGDHAGGAYIDTLEFGFSAVLPQEDRARLRALLEDAVGADALQRVAWPDDGRRAFVTLQPGNYPLQSICAAVEAGGFSLVHRGGYYSARLGKREAPVGSLSEKR